MCFPFFRRTVIDRRIAEPRQYLTFAIREDRPCVAIDLSYRCKQFLLDVVACHQSLFPSPQDHVMVVGSIAEVSWIKQHVTCAKRGPARFRWLKNFSVIIRHSFQALHDLNGSLFLQANREELPVVPAITPIAI